MSSSFKDLFTRVFSAILIALIAIPVIWFGGFPRSCFFLILIASAMFEYLSASVPLPKKNLFLFTSIYMIAPLGLYLGGVEILYWLGLFVFVATALSLCLIAELSPNQPDVNIVVPRLLSGLVYPGVPLSLLILVDTEFSWEKILWLISTVVAVDITAYFVGRLAGGRPLSPRISPNKTLSGAVSGILGASLISLAWGSSFQMDQPVYRLMALGLLVGIVSVLGDLFESLIKRSLGVKDLGTVLPGHGGILDRIDALIFAAPIIFFL